MRNLLIKYLAGQYDYRLNGKTGGHLRAVNTVLFLFCFAGNFNLLTPGFDIWQIIVFVPFIAAALIWGVYFKKYPPLLHEMTWQQQFQKLSKGAKNIAEREKLKELRGWMEDTFDNTRANNVEAMRFWWNWIVIIITILIIAGWGFREAGFGIERLF